MLSLRASINSEWQKFLDCYTAKSTDDIKTCQLLAQDYDECLHHRKEKARAQRIAAEYERRAAKGEDVPAVEKRKLNITLEDASVLHP